MRKYLPDLNIVGALCVYSEGDICRYSIESLLAHCNKIVIALDHPDDYTRKIVMEYKEQYPDVFEVEDNDLPALSDKERLMARHKRLQGEIREYALKMTRKEHAKRPIDILIFPDSDEMFTYNLPNVLKSFWESTVDTIFIRPLEIYDDFHIIVNQGLVSHARIYKYVPEITAVPYSQQTFYQPYRDKRNIIKLPWNYLHLARLTKESREYRERTRNNKSRDDFKLRRVSKPAYELTPEEGWKVMRSEKFLLLGDYDGDINKVPLIL